MFRTLKIFLIVLGLGIFILPKQMIFAQQTEQCCEPKTTETDCCKTDKKTDRHSEKSHGDSKKNDCSNDCTNCNSCSQHLVFNFLSPDFFNEATHQTVQKKLSFTYKISFYSSKIHHIWQPPKIV